MSKNEQTGGGWNPPTPRPRPSPPQPAPEPFPKGEDVKPIADIDPDRPFGPAEVADDELAMSDAVVGWLVIVQGPGRGTDYRLKSGINSLGRGDGAAVDIAFGDRGIADGVHCRLTFDPRTKRFFLSPGDGRYITYSNDQPVLTTIELQSMQDFEMGSTVLRFVPFCSPAFTWTVS